MTRSAWDDALTDLLLDEEIRVARMADRASGLAEEVAAAMIAEMERGRALRAQR